MAIDLSDLIEFPRETLDVELKEWLDLKNGLVRAKLARHLAALANHGGGYLVFGIKNDLSIDEQRPSSLVDYNQDEFTSIVKRYLMPTFQCEVSIVINKYGTEFPLVRVPSHKRVPIVAKADGPKDDRGRIQGITAGTYYIRKPGPESAPIVGPEEWAALIRRCVLNDRDSLLSDFADLMQGTEKATLSDQQRLEQWHREGEERFILLLAQTGHLRWQVPIKENHCQLSYLIVTSDGAAISENSAKRILEEVNNEVRSTVWTGWSMFYPFTRSEIAPTFHPERADGTGPDVLEANLMGDLEYDTALPDFWRVALDGRVTLIRAYREDRERSARDTGRAVGTWLSPETIIRETTELVTHARLLARRFETATQIVFRCTWVGLKDRELADFSSAVYWSPGRIAKSLTQKDFRLWSPLRASL
jgi:hypothetical protein